MPLALSPRTPCATPLGGTYRRLGEVSPLLRIEVGRPDANGRWVTGRRLAEDPAVRDCLVATEEERIRDAYGVRPRRDVAATWVLHRYAFTVSLAMSGPWYLERRVPRLPLDGVAYDERERALRVAPSALSCLPDDPAAAMPGIRVLPDEDALRAELRGAVAGHLAPVLDAFRPLLRRGPRALWGMVGDELTEGIWHLGRALGEPQAAAEAAGALLPGGTAPFAGGAGFRPAAPGGAEPTRTRTGCCLYYTIRPGEVCATCPRLRGGALRN